MYFFVFLTQPYLSKCILKICKTAILNAIFLLKWAQNLSKFIRFHKWTAIF